MERDLSFKEFMQREIPRINRMFAMGHPITSLTNLVFPLLREMGRDDLIKEIENRINKIESIVGKEIEIIEKWIISNKGFMKVKVKNKWGKSVYKKVYKNEVDKKVYKFISWVFSDIIYNLLYQGDEAMLNNMMGN